jgi:hypothetical protein
MSSGSGKFLKTVDGRLLFGLVRVEFTPSENRSLEVHRAADIFAELGEADAKAPGFVAWARAAELGARWGARVANVSMGSIDIRRIVGRFTDTTERSIASAAALAVWNAVGFGPETDARRQLDEIAISGGPLVD